MSNSKNILLHWAGFIVLSISSVIMLHYLVKDKLGNCIQQNIKIATYESLLTAIFIPIYLIIISYYMQKKSKKKIFPFFLNTILIMFCVWLSSYFHFENWANSIGNKHNPDSGTTEVIGLTRAVGYLICTIGMAIMFFKLRKNR